MKKFDMHYYAVKDLKIGFAQLFTCPNDAAALRSWKQALRAENLPFKDNPADYELWSIGIFDTETGEFTDNLYMVAEENE